MVRRKLKDIEWTWEKLLVLRSWLLLKGAVLGQGPSFIFNVFLPLHLHCLTVYRNRVLNQAFMDGLDTICVLPDIKNRVKDTCTFLWRVLRFHWVLRMHDSAKHTSLQWLFILAACKNHLSSSWKLWMTFHWYYWIRMSWEGEMEDGDSQNKVYYSALTVEH